MVRILLSKKLGEKRWNQKMLAGVSKVRAATVSAWFNEDIKSISLEHLYKICKALECDISDILVIDDTESD